MHSQRELKLNNRETSLMLALAGFKRFVYNGALLGWLIDRENRQVYIYRPRVAVECLDNPANVSGDPVLPGLILDLSKIW